MNATEVAAPSAGGLHLVAATVMVPTLTRRLRVIAQGSEHLAGSIDDH